MFHQGISRDRKDLYELVSALSNKVKQLEADNQNLRHEAEQSNALNKQLSYETGTPGLLRLRQLPRSWLGS